MMTLERQVIFWVAALAIFMALLWLLRDVALPFVAGMALAYLTDPLARRAEALGIGRTTSALIILALVIVAVVAAVMVTAPILIQQFTAFIDKLPGYVARLQSLVADPSQTWLSGIFGEQGPDASKAMSSLVSQGSGFLAGFLASIWSGGRAVLSLLSILIITPVVAFYLLCDWERVVATVDNWIPLKHRATIHGLARDIDSAIAGFVRGQAVICMLLAVFYGVGLTIAGLHFGFLIGIATGFLSFIPYVGAMSGFLMAAVVAIAQFWPDLGSLAIVAGVFAAGQVLEGYVLSPKLVGAKVGLHPVWMMFSLLAFGYLMGFIGLLIAIPLAATFGVLLRFAVRKYQQSSIYTGGGSDMGPR
jgi:predicted PurR-regulated permease PerM